MIEFPRLHSSIPIPPTPLVGREHALAATLDRLGEPDVRLVTLTGPGGVGKTRLALELARTVEAAFADGVCFVPLETVGDAELVPAAIARGLRVGAFGARSALAAAVEAVRRREHLLVLDNFEHVLAAAPVVADLLAAGPGLRILVTSREALRLRGEHELVVPPLPWGGTREAGGGTRELAILDAAPAVTLFCQRARAARSDFVLCEANAADVAAICARLDGLPLAIELAAARVSQLAPGAILERIDRQRSARFSLLTGGPRDAPVRLRTMRDAIAWSHDLLDAGGRVLFRTLAVFTGGFTIAAAAAIGEMDEAEVLDGIRSLLAKSLLWAEADCSAETRFGMLETIRAFGWERLAASGEAKGVRQRHADWCLALAVHAGAKVKGPDDAIWLPRLEREHANLRAALAWLMEEGDTRSLMRLAGALWPFWEEHAHYREGRHWLETALAYDGAAPPADRLRVLTGAGTMARHHADFACASMRHEQALTLARQLGDREAEAMALNYLGAQAMELGDFDVARARFADCIALARQAGTPHLVIRARHNLAEMQRVQRDSAAARQNLEQVLVLAREQRMGWLLPSILGGLGLTAADLGDGERAIALFHESLSLAMSKGTLGSVVDGIEGLARVAAVLGQAEPAIRLFGAGEALREKLVWPLSPTEIAYAAPIMDRLQEARGAHGFAAAWEQGRLLSQEEALEEALAIRAEPAASVPHGLTVRERDVLRLVAEGLSDKEIGAALAISAQTATKHVGNILRKLGVSSRTAAATLAVREGLISTTSE